MLSDNKKYIIGGIVLYIVLGFLSIFIGKYPLSLKEMLAGNELHWRIFMTLRLSRTLMGIFGGFALGITGFVYQTVFRNPLAAPDILGVSSGASAGAAAGILFFSGIGNAVFGVKAGITLFSFVGALLAVGLALLLASIDHRARNSSIILAGIAVHSLAQTVLMCLKLIADPEKELASIEYWIMGSLSGVSLHSMWGNMIVCFIGIACLFMLYRQIILLSAEEGEAKMLGVSVGKIRLLLLLIATFSVACVISLCGIISFVGLISPHIARRLLKNNSKETMLLGGIIGGCLLLAADILARSVTETELPVSIFTSMIGAPFMIFLIMKGRREV